LWSTNTGKIGGAILEIRDNGKIAISLGEEIYWSSGLGRTRDKLRFGWVKAGRPEVARTGPDGRFGMISSAGREGMTSLSRATPGGTSAIPGSLSPTRGASVEMDEPSRRSDRDAAVIVGGVLTGGA
jgi:hypothetical protein